MMKALTTTCTVLFLAGIVGCATYSPKPLAPANTLGGFEARRLDAPSLRQFMTGSAAFEKMPWPPPGWDLRLLTLAALHFHPDLDVARAKWGVAKAGIVTAGQRPNPSLGFLALRDTPVEAGVSPWALRPSVSIPIETAGKRGYRVAQANHLADAEWLGVTAAAWRVRSRLRAALADRLLAEQELELLKDEEAVRGEIVGVLEARVAAGDVAPQLLTDARIDLSRIRQLRQLGEGSIDQSHAALADSLGVPATAVAGIRLVFPQVDALPPEAALGDGSTGLAEVGLRRRALLGRADLLRALLEYAAAEAALQLEVARQYPDLDITPGYQWGEPQNTWRLGLSVALPVFNQNQGPIAEAEARRELAAASFVALQSGVVGELNTALARYRSAVRSHALAGELLQAAEARQKTTQEAFDAGDVDRGAVLSVRLETATARRDRVAALRNAQTALGALEDAVQWPLDGSLPLPALPEKNPRTAPGTMPTREEQRGRN